MLDVCVCVCVCIGLGYQHERVNGKSTNNEKKVEEKHSFCVFERVNWNKGGEERYHRVITRTTVA